jgi:hypothetical protein
MALPRRILFATSSPSPVHGFSTYASEYASAVSVCGWSVSKQMATPVILGSVLFRHELSDLKGSGLLRTDDRLEQAGA